MPASGGLDNDDDYGLSDFELDDDLDSEDDETEWEADEEATADLNDSSSRHPQANDPHSG